MRLKPVFIIGAGRSGTKFLRDTLSASDFCARVPYDVGYIWRYGNEGLLHDEIDPDSLNIAQINWIRSKLMKMMDKDNPRPNAQFLLEKSVPNTLRLALLLRCYPDAKFIQIIREGHAVTESAMRMWMQPLKKEYLIDKIRYFPWSNYRYGIWFLKNWLLSNRSNIRSIWGPRYAGIQEDILTLPLHVVCAKQWAKCVELSNRQLSQFPVDQFITVRYEELMENTIVLEKICDFIGIPSAPVLEKWRETAQHGNNEKWRVSLSAEQISDIDHFFAKLPDELKIWIGNGKAPEE